KRHSRLLPQAAAVELPVPIEILKRHLLIRVRADDHTVPRRKTRLVYRHPPIHPAYCTTQSANRSGTRQLRRFSAASVCATHGRSHAASNHDSGGTAGYTVNSRWGDYPAVTADPSDPTAVWVLGEW